MTINIASLFVLLAGLAHGFLPLPPQYNRTRPSVPTGKVFTNSSGTFGGCVGGIQAYPSDWPNSNYYQRYCRSTLGLAVVTDGIAPDAALERTAWTLDNMMATMDSIVANKLIESGFRQAVMGRYPSETVTSLPEYSNQDPAFWNNRRGCGAQPGAPVGCNAEEDVLCYPDDDLYPYMDITVHEFGHTLHLLGFNQIWPQFQEGLDACYNNAYYNNLWGSGYIGSYSMTNAMEYFANGLMTYFDVQYPYDDQAPATRTELYQMDPQFADFIDTWMYSNPWRGGCP